MTHKRKEQPITDNAVEATLGREQLKWDALWHLFGWLLDRRQPHGLGRGVVNSLCRHAFERTFDEVAIKTEFQLSKIQDGKGKWPDLALGSPSLEEPEWLILMDDVDLRSPRSSRKLNNLESYRSTAQQCFPTAKLCIVVLTNAQDSSFESTLSKLLSPGFDEPGCWKLLSLSTVGRWVEDALRSSQDVSTSKIEFFLRDFIKWSNSLDPNALSS